MGMGASNVEARVAASIGALADPVEPEFQSALDIPNGGVLCALPALLAMGLLKTTERFFELPKGYYGLKSIFILLAFMALTRLKSIESLRYCAPGEWGNLLGLDRVPEVRTLRQKIRLLSKDDCPEQWSGELCKEWMNAAPEHAGTLYVDGHVRVYNGHQTKLPRHHVARQKLCLRATCDYWINAMDGQPFFVVNQVVDPGMIKVIEQDILPRLLRDVPGQPNESELAADPLLHRFRMVFDREGYSPAFFKRMKEKRIACMTYHKYPGENWSKDEFHACNINMPNGQMVEMKLAERDICPSNKLRVREIRKLTNSGHQTAIITTDYKSKIANIAISMFSRWSQENFFKYTREHYSLDLVDTIKMVAYRAETAMANQLRETISRPDEARSLLRMLYTSDADFLPDHKEGILTVRLHHMTNRAFDTAIRKLCEELNATETRFPGTDLRLRLELGSN